MPKRTRKQRNPQTAISNIQDARAARALREAGERIAEGVKKTMIALQGVFEREEIEPESAATACIQIASRIAFHAGVTRAEFKERCGKIFSECNK